jgi:uncharacterized protein YktB (UPF0637 family)
MQTQNNTIKRDNKGLKKNSSPKKIAIKNTIVKPISKIRLEKLPSDIAFSIEHTELLIYFTKTLNNKQNQSIIDRLVSIVKNLEENVSVQKSLNKKI